MSNMDVVNRIYAAFAAGNIPAVLEWFDPAIEWFAARILRWRIAARTVA